MKVLVAGTGFIGSRVVERLSGEHEIKTLDRDSGDYQKDVTEDFELDEEFDVVFHTIGLPPGMNRPEQYWRVHVEGTRNILEGVETDKVVYLSALKAGEIGHSFFRTKKEAEDLIKESKIDYTIVRPSTVYGRGNKLMEMIRSVAPLRVFPDIKTQTQPIHVNDLVRILEKSLGEFGGEILKVAGPEKMTVGEMARKIYSEEGFSCILIPTPEFLQRTSLKLVPLSGPFNSENIELLRHQNTVEENDAERILDSLKKI